LRIHKILNVKNVLNFVQNVKDLKKTVPKYQITKFKILENLTRIKFKRLHLISKIFFIKNLTFYILNNLFKISHKYF
jgi:formylmethanofuran dehydrogenase subunit A